MTDFKLGDRVKTPDGEGEIIDIEPGEDTPLLVAVPGESDWYYAEYELEPVEQPPLQDWEKELLFTPFEQSVHRVTGKIADLLIAKNKAYGDSALNPLRIFSKASRIEGIHQRIDDKLSRVARGEEYPGDDTVRDLIGYLCLLLIARESE